MTGSVQVTERPSAYRTPCGTAPGQRRGGTGGVRIGRPLACPVIEGYAGQDAAAVAPPRRPVRPDAAPAHGRVRREGVGGHSAQKDLSGTPRSQFLRGCACLQVDGSLRRVTWGLVPRARGPSGAKSQDLVTFGGNAADGSNLTVDVLARISGAQRQSVQTIAGLEFANGGSRQCHLTVVPDCARM